MISALTLFRFPAIALLTLIALAATARADDFSFSFTNDPNYGNVGGTVTGEIIGITNNATSAATQVIITSFPAGLNSVFGTGPIGTTLWDQQLSNSFTETNGVITDLAFKARQTVGAQTFGGQLYLGFDSIDFLNLDGDDLLHVWNDDGLPAITFTLLSSSPTPEPSSLILLATGLAGAAGAARRRWIL